MPPTMRRAPAGAAGQRGMIAPTGVLALSIVAVAFASVGYVLTSHPGRVDAASTPPAPRPTVTSPATVPTPSPSASHTPTVRHTAPPVRRSSVSVVVFNNSNVKGLAARTAARAHQAGWTVVGQDNWYGTISSSTVYYPASLQRAARLLAHDLGITRVMPAIAPMRSDRLTVILTADYAG